MEGWRMETAAGFACGGLPLPGIAANWAAALLWRHWQRCSGLSHALGPLGSWWEFLVEAATAMAVAAVGPTGAG